MADIFHRFPVGANKASVFSAISSPAGLDQWWSKSSSGNPELEATYDLNFGEGYDWQAIVTKCDPGREFELQLTKADGDWIHTRVGFILSAKGDSSTDVMFYHSGWPDNNDHFKTSSFCWAMYLRIMKRNVEFGEVVAYEKRLDV